MHELNLNIGLTTENPDGFVDALNLKAADVPIDINNGFAYPSNSVSNLYCFEYLDNTTMAQRMAFFREFRRILKPGGLLRLVQKKDAVEQNDASSALPDVQKEARICGFNSGKTHKPGRSSRSVFKNIASENDGHIILEWKKAKAESNDQPLVSILIPAYNPRYFAESVQSALDQSYPNLEIIVCDDSDTDEIKQTIDALSRDQRKISYFKNEQHLGGRGNYLRCLSEANSDYIKYLNDDDKLHPECIARMVPHLVENPDVALVTAHRELIDKDGNILEDRHFNSRPVDADSIFDGVSLIREVLDESLNIIGEPTTVLFRKSAMADADPSMMDFAGKRVHFNGDVAMWMNLLSKGDAVYLVDTLSSFRLHDEQRQSRDDARELSITAWKQLKADAEAYGFYYFKSKLAHSIVELSDSRVPSSRRSPYRPIVSKYLLGKLLPEKLKLIDHSFEKYSIKSFADLGGVWGIDAGYTFYAMDNYPVNKAFIVDTDILPNVKTYAQFYPELNMVSGNFGSQSSADQVDKIDAVFLFDVLLHQVNPNWDKVLSIYAEKTKYFVIYNQQFTDSEKTVRLLELGKDEYFRNVPHNEQQEPYRTAFSDLDAMHPQHKRKYRDIHNIWQWGIVDDDLYNTLKDLGYVMLYFKDCGRFGSLPNFFNHAFLFYASPQKAPEMPDFATMRPQVEVLSETQKEQLKFADMKNDWNERAVENAKYYVRSTDKEQSEEEFDLSGKKDVQDMLLDEIPDYFSGRSLDQLKILEIGCGIGRMTKHLASYFNEVHGVDVSGEMIREAGQRLKDVDNAFVYENGGYDLAQFEDQSFDVVFSFIVFQHIPHKEAIYNYIREAARVLKKNGVFKFQVQGCTDPDWLNQKKDTWHGQTITEQEVKELSRELGFTIKSMSGQGGQYAWYTVVKDREAEPVQLSAKQSNAVPDPILENHPEGILYSQSLSMCKNPVFVVGCFRSGTSVMAQSLAKHSKTWISGESDFMIPLAEGALNAYTFGTQRGNYHWLYGQKVSLAEFFAAIGMGINILYSNRSKGKRWIEQTPQYTLAMKEMSLMFPGARFVNIIRDGRDVVHSMLNSGFNEAWAADFDLACKTWVNFVLNGLKFETEHSDRVVRVYNELMVGDTEHNMQSLCSNLDLEYENSMCDYFANGKKLNSSFDQKKKSGWRDTWTDEQKLRFEQIAGPLMKALGYYESSQWLISESAIENKPASELSSEDILEKYTMLVTKPEAKKTERRISGQNPDVPKVSIVIPVFNNLEFNHRCIKAIYANTHYGNYEIIVSDNKSTDGSREYFEQINKENFILVANDENLGFTLGCNAAAEKSSGEYIVFLNNDTEVQPGWLNKLVELMLSKADAGAVGSKLVYPDGTLQEAGAIVFSDGNGWNYGRGFNPDDPRFNFVREVDYCSGAALMVRRNVWNALGGFDERYAPAYYEDTDLCFGVRSLGYRVYYQPASTVVHFEGKTAGTDLNSGMKKYQSINREKFVDKWQDQLVEQFANNAKFVVEASDRSTKRNILVADPFLPYYDRASGSLRLFHILKMLKQMDFHVTFIARNGSYKETYEPVLQALGIETFSWDVEAMKAAGVDLKDTENNIPHEVLLRDRNYDYAIIDFWEMANFYLPKLRKYSKHTKVIIDSVDVHFIRELREAQLAKDAGLKKKALENKKKEIAAYKKADTVWVVTEADRNELKKHVKNVPVKVVPNIHSEVAEQKEFEKTKDLLFVGNFSHTPNIDAINYFVHDIFPLVRKTLPDITLNVVGNNPPPAIQQLAGEGINVTGYVPDIAPYLFGARVSVSPLRYGAGMKGKVGEALSWGLPVVTTSIGAEGMGLSDGQHALIADDAQIFADRVIQLYSDETTWNRLSREGQKLVRKNWSPTAIFEQLKMQFNHNEKEQVTSIVMLSYNAVEYTKKCVHSIIENTQVPYELIIVDNGSNAKTIQYLKTLNKKHSQVTVIFNKENKGFAAGNNIGAKQATGDNILILNNDVLVGPGWLRKLNGVLNKDASIGMVGPITNYISGLQRVTNVPYESDNFMEFASKVATVNADKATPRRRIAGFCMLMPKSVYDQVGGFDESFGTGNFEDDDLCLRLRQAGYAIMVAEDVFIHHYGSKSFEANNIDYSQSLEEKGGIFKERWPNINYRELLEQENPLSEIHPLALEAATNEIGLGHIEKAAEIYRAVCVENPLNGEALLGAAICARAEEDYDLALNYLQRLLKQQPENPLAYNQTGIVSAQRGDLHSARDMFMRAIQLDNTMVDAQRNYGEILLEMGEYENSIRVFKQILHNHPDEKGTLFNMAQLSAEAGKNDQALEYVETVLKFDPEDATAKEMKVILLNAKNASVQPVETDDLSSAEDALSVGDYDRALQIYQQWLENHPDNSTALYGSGLAHQAKGNQEQAGEIFKRLLQKDPQFADGYYALGTISFNAGDFSGAVNYLSSVLKFDGDNRQAKQMLVECLLQLEDYESALKLLNSIIAHNPEDTEALIRLGELYFEAGRPEDALDLFRKAKDFEPDNQSLAENIAWLEENVLAGKNE